MPKRQDLPWPVTGEDPAGRAVHFGTNGVHNPPAGGDSGEQAKGKKFPGWGAGLFIQRAWHAWPCAEPTPSLSVIDTPSSAACAHLWHSAWSFPSTSRPRLWKGFSHNALVRSHLIRNVLHTTYYGTVESPPARPPSHISRYARCSTLLYTSCVYFVTTCTKYSPELFAVKRQLSRHLAPSRRRTGGPKKRYDGRGSRGGAA
jgi:hypothetical protein